MAKKTNSYRTSEKSKAKAKSKPAKKKTNWRKKISEQQKLRRSVGVILILVSIYLFISMISYMFSWQIDQDKVDSQGFWSFVILQESDAEVKNWLGKLGAFIAHQLMHNAFGISSLLLAFFTFLLGVRALLKISLLPLGRTAQIASVSAVWLSITLAFAFPPPHDFAGGTFGYQIAHWLGKAVGSIGTVFFILFSGLIGVIVLFNPNWENLVAIATRKLSNFSKSTEPEPINENSVQNSKTVPVEDLINTESVIQETPDEPSVSHDSKDEIDLDLGFEVEITESSEENAQDQTLEIIEDSDQLEVSSTENISEPLEEEAMEVKVADDQDEVLSDRDLNKMVKEFGEYDPKLDLSSYILPNIEILADHGGGNISINKEELEGNKNRIIETLSNYNISISKIKATIGPTVTLYEIVPAPGVRISKIKNLEDDIALSLAALGIRIIAPMPGKGTIGIEVPNSKPDIVSMRTLIASDKFQNSEMELPLALGKTIANETFIADLTKMPHMLMAGATGQGKSVGLNAILVSILYKKHPSQVKFVLVDPKKVELTLFNKIERHFLAKLPDEEDAIITDTSKVVATLNSLCIEMDNRYELLKDAMVRNIKEYNAKFVRRKLNPENGHRYLPYIVLVIDEFADLIMTAGKEVETPIARLAQLARAIGIHLIVATQRPSVNVITGIIKANFPARIAFRVTSKIDSRTILDAGGADRLIGRGDMLYSPGNELIRLQCPFVDTPEVEEITDFIGGQRGYPDALLLPEYVDESASQDKDFSDEERDSLFEEAAEVIVNHQQGSASLLQRKLKLGYNRAGRIVDQLETAGIIGPHKGSKAREVLIPDIMALEQFLAAQRKDHEIQ